jgi:hypothetical protein
MKQLKAAASLSSSLLLLKGRTNPAALVDKILGDAGAPRDAAPTAELHRIETVPRDRDRPETNVIMPWRGMMSEPRRSVLDNLSRKKLSLRLDRVRHFRLKLVAYHLGISAQELLTRALESYIEQVAPEMARTRPLPPAEIRSVAGPGSGDHRDALAATTPALRPHLDSD